ncbi:hypothetical protein CV102_01140 [Natronococcus pandeyae]|uniref:Uncharacterized protein n=1 Tax=Natronococcus pandeyae TaxID=2055836 RepID=A0A8J8Q6X2_9EURY|nr:hypothetical protein [Natronococcus pandeyae]TYL40217.1 hypothetical protein CV102_01140 [Natronococcus pandeyae]
MERPLGLASFDEQSRLAHVLTVAVAVVVCCLGYFGAVVAVYGDLSVLAPETSVEQQRVGGVVGSICVWAYFALAFVRGYGGPVLNTLVYPVAIVLLAPFVGRWLLFGPDLAGLADRFVGLLVVEPLLTTVIVMVPGFGAFLTLLALWGTRTDESERRDWERRHLSDDFYEEFIAEDSD